MKIPNVNLSESTQNALNMIIKESKKPQTVGRQMVMANYYGYLCSKAKTDSKDFAKLLLSK